MAVFVGRGRLLLNGITHFELLGLNALGPGGNSSSGKLPIKSRNVGIAARGPVIKARRVL